MNKRLETVAKRAWLGSKYQDVGTDAELEQAECWMLTLGSMPARPVAAGRAERVVVVVFVFESFSECCVPPGLGKLDAFLAPSH